MTESTKVRGFQRMLNARQREEDDRMVDREAGKEEKQNLRILECVKVGAGAVISNWVHILSLLYLVKTR